MNQQEINLSMTASFEDERFETRNSHINPDRYVWTASSPDPLIVRDGGDKKFSAACHGDDMQRSPDKRRTMKEIREKINNVRKQIWYNWNYLALLSEINEGEIGVISAGEYNRLSSPVKRNFIIDEDWTFLQTTAKKLEDELGPELDAVPDDIDFSHLQGLLSGLQYACGDEEWEPLYSTYSPGTREIVNL